MNINEVVNCLVYDEELAKILLCPEKNFKDYTLKEGEMDSLAWSQIFPYAHVPHIGEIAKSYITMSFRYNRSGGSNKFLVGQATIFAFCHESLIRTDYGELRYNCMLDRINKMMDSKRMIKGIGKMELVTIDDFSISNDEYSYFGIEAVYRNVEYM